MIAHFNLIDGRPTLWDLPQEDSLPLKVVIKDGKITIALSPRSMTDLRELLAYNWVDEKQHLEEMMEDGDEEGVRTHIFHNIKRLQELF